MITTRDPAVLSSNRGNDLLVQLLQFRYPHIVNEKTLPVLWEWLTRQHAQQLELAQEHGMETALCNSIINSYVMENSHSFPCQIGADMEDADRLRMTLFLASMYMDDFDSTHGVPLPANMFRVPWSPTSDID